jgi:hypothetical protein
MQTERELNDNETLNREVVDASMSIALDIVNRSDIAFTISNIELTAKVRDPRDPSRFVHVATLVGNAGSVNVGPAPFARGPLRFTATGVTPALIEELRVDPRGIIFEVVNYDVTDEFGRNLAFRSQDVNDRTATLLIDYNGFLPFEPLRVATYSGFNPDGSADGIKMGDAFEKILGLIRRPRQDAELRAVPDDLDARGIDTCTPAARAIDTSYSTRQSSTAARSCPSALGRGERGAASSPGSSSCRAACCAATSASIQLPPARCSASSSPRTSTATGSPRATRRSSEASTAPSTCSTTRASAPRPSPPTTAGPGTASPTAATPT